MIRLSVATRSTFPNAARAWKVPGLLLRARAERYRLGLGGLPLLALLEFCSVLSEEIRLLRATLIASSIRSGRRPTVL